MVTRLLAIRRFCVHLFVVPDSGSDHYICSLVSADYDRGYADGYAARSVESKAEFEALHVVADYWYFRANNPGVKTADQIVVESIIDGMEVRERRARMRAEMDAADAAKFAEARALIAGGLDDVDIAVKVGLFAPTVANIRAGVL